jgi:hypothetical protein
MLSCNNILKTETRVVSSRRHRGYYTKKQKEKSRNVLLRVSISAPLMAEIKKIKKVCKDTRFYFDIKPDIISAVEKAVEKAKAMVQKEKNKN